MSVMASTGKKGKATTSSSDEQQLAVLQLQRPELSEISSRGLITFYDEYEQYVHRGLRLNVPVDSMFDCLAIKARRSLVGFTGQMPADASNEEFREVFSKMFPEVVRSAKNVEDVFRNGKLTYDLTIRESAARIHKFLEQAFSLLEGAGIQHYLEKKSGRKQIVTALVDRLKPLGVQVLIRGWVSLQPKTPQIRDLQDQMLEIIKPADDLFFAEKLGEEAKGFENSPSSLRRPRVESSGADSQQKISKKLKNEDWKLKKTSSSKTHDQEKGPKNAPKEGNSTDTDVVCWGCNKKGHSMVDCRSTTEGEKEKILASKRAEWKAKRAGSKAN